MSENITENPSKLVKNLDMFYGKTIKYILQDTINCWQFVFTDGTHAYMWAENDGPLGIGQLWASKEQ